MNSCKTDLDKPPHKPANILLRLLGPGLVTGAANDDPSGIATYSQAGAQFGYALLWTVFLTTPFMIAIQLVSAQIGRVTGKGIIANVRDFAPRWLVISLVAMLVMANTFNIAADLAAIGKSLSLVIGGLNQENALIFAAASNNLKRYNAVESLKSARRNVLPAHFDFKFNCVAIDINIRPIYSSETPVQASCTHPMM